MSPEEYEQVVADIVMGLRDEAADLHGMVLGSGRKNRLLGASSYEHQIDVSLSNSRTTYLIECKRWNAKIGVDEVMILAARSADIAYANRSISVRAILASRVGATRGARTLAEYFHIEIERVQSAQEFGLRVGRHVGIGIGDSLSMTDDVFCVQIRNGIVVE